MSSSFNDKLLLCTTLDLVKKAKLNGKLHLKNLYLIKILNDFINNEYLYTKDSRNLKLLNINIKNQNNILLKEQNLNIFSNIKYCKDCDKPSYNIVLPEKQYVDSNVISLDNNVYRFKHSDFTKNFSSPDNSLPKYIKILSLPTEGIIKYNNVNIILPFSFDLVDIDKLTFNLDKLNQNLVLNFNFQTSNSLTNITFSNMATFAINIEDYINQPPNAVGNNNINIQNASSYIFKQDDFTTNTVPPYSDPENDPANNLKILSLPTQGFLKLNGINITINTIVSFLDILNGNLIYESYPLNQNSHNINFSFELSDSGSNIFVGPGIFTINIKGSVNQPPNEVGDNSITITNSTTYIFTEADFTINTTPPYSDPEGDSVKDIKIISLPLAGLLKLNGVNVSINDEIDFTEVINGNLIYESDQMNTSAQNVSFNFELSDTGSNTFVG